MLRTFVQIMRSGAVGRKSLGTRPKRLIQQWLDRRDDQALFRDAVGRDPSLADIIKMVHPRPVNKRREAFYGYLIGKQADPAELPRVVGRYEEYKRTRSGAPPDVPFQMLTALELGREQWTAIAMRAGWQMTRMNLNTFRRHGVFEDQAAVEAIARRLRDPELIAGARVFPYQLMVAYTMAHPDTPEVIRDALQEALELATANVPRIEGKVYVLPDVSGSMRGSAITGSREGATSVVRCLDVAALLAASILRRNKEAQVLAFDDKVYEPRLNPRDSIMTNAEKLAGLGGGGTNCGAPLELLNQRSARGDLVIYISDNQSWLDVSAWYETAAMLQWNRFKERNPRARMVCLDIQPDVTTMAAEREDIMNIGGFNDAVFRVIGAFAQSGLDAGHWVAEIQKVRL
jgi:60 kDa SS-A/Ro ribonucleoprotein